MSSSHLTVEELKFNPEIKQEIEEDNAEMVLKNVTDNTLSQQIKEEFDEYEEDIHHEVDHISQHELSRQVITRSLSTDHLNLNPNTNLPLVDDGQLENQGILDDNLKDEHDQTGVKECDRTNGQSVEGCVKEEEEDVCGCDDVNVHVHGQLDNQGILDDDNQVFDGQMNTATDNATQQDWHKHEIKVDDAHEQVNRNKLMFHVNSQSGNIIDHNMNNPQLNATTEEGSEEVKEEFDDEEECDCDECVYGGIEVKEEVDGSDAEEVGRDDIENDNDNSEGTENDESTRPVGNAQMDTTSSHPIIEQSRTIVRQSERLAKRKQRQQPNEVYNRDNQEESSRPVRIARSDITLPLNGQSTVIRQSTRLSKRKQTHDESNQINNRDNQEDMEEDDDEVPSRSVKRPSHSTTSSGTQEKQIITLTLRCPQVRCGKMFPKNEYAKHLKEKHSIGPFRCVVKKCGKSFDKSSLLGQHLKQAHQHTTQWYCEKCSKHYPTYKLLSIHSNKQHQLGNFLCSFSECSFMGEYKGMLYDHYRQHKQFNCQHSGCHYQTLNAANLKQHERTHSGIKPYRCKWPQCGFASNNRPNTFRHIRNQHLAPNSGSVPNGAQLDPKDYFEVVDDLLESNEQANQISNQNKQFITLRLQCPQSNCSKMFPEDQLNDHIRKKHSIDPNQRRCLVKKCGQSFKNHIGLGKHIKQVHKHTTQWCCNKCPKHFDTYQDLSIHKIEYHQLGHFQCSFPSCTFTGECRKKIHSHYAWKHKQIFNCPHSGCRYRTQKESELKKHLRTHLKS